MRRVGEIVDQIDLQGKNQELVDELVALSTRHGILTPYTSFLADDATNLRDLAVNRNLTEQRLELLEQTAGRAAFDQRRAKSYYQYSVQAESDGFARQPILATADAAVPADAAVSRPAIAASGRSSGPAGSEGDESTAVQTVQNVGMKTFFLRQGRWVDSSLTQEQEKNVVKLVRFSPEFFDLISQHGQEVAKYLAIEGEVTVVLSGQAYSF